MRISSLRKFSFFIILFISIASCKKGPGEGGRASITGRVFARNYSNSFVLMDSSFIGGQKVYIQYGDEIGVSNDVDTDAEGRFLFPYLREGKYSIWVYSKQLANNTLDQTLMQTITISSKKQQVELPRFTINTLKN